MDLEKLSTEISEDIDRFVVEKYTEEHRRHLGASQIGEDCKRKLWYAFRWCYKEKHNARMLRLFNRGHREEERFAEYLKGIGVQVWLHDVKGKQYTVSDVHGHFGGSLDGVGILPAKYGIEGPVLLEFKTSGNKGFSAVQKSGMKFAKPQHFAQISVYGTDETYKFKYCLYLMVNKDNDTLHVELVELDKELGKQMRRKAELIILSEKPPPKISESKTYFACNLCAARDVCHNGAPPERNCRSCRHAAPAERANWYCDHHKADIPVEYIPNACPHYEKIT